MKALEQTIVEEWLDQLQEVLAYMQPKDRVRAIIQLVDFVLPKSRENRVSFKQKSEAELDNILQNLIENDDNIQ